MKMRMGFTNTMLSLREARVSGTEVKGRLLDQDPPNSSSKPFLLFACTIVSIPNILLYPKRGGLLKTRPAEMLCVAWCTT
eukprot:1141674-Pelagomonas_calceolata.AAC.5